MVGSQAGVGVGQPWLALVAVLCSMPWQARQAGLGVAEARGSSLELFGSTCLHLQPPPRGRRVSARVAERALCGSLAKHRALELGRTISAGLEQGWGLGPGPALRDLAASAAQPWGDVHFRRGQGPASPLPRHGLARGCGPPAPRRQLRGQGESCGTLLGGPLVPGSKWH